MNFDSTCIIAHNDQRQPLKEIEKKDGIFDPRFIFWSKNFWID